MVEPAIIVPHVDWATIGSATERRRRQNRINQRAQRQRRRALEGKPYTSDNAKDTTDNHKDDVLLARLASDHCFKGLNILGPKADSSIQLLGLLEAAVRKAYDARSPRTDILLGLTQLNVWRALVVNIEVLGLTPSEMHDDALSPFSISYTYHPRMNNLPAALKPTSIQQTVPHHPWLDLLPDAALRNNLILLDAAGLLDEDRCCLDMCGQTGVIVWRDPWDHTGWEVTPAFLEKWRLVLTGCWGLFRSTNYWREQRGEKKISRDMWVEGNSGS